MRFSTGFVGGVLIAGVLGAVPAFAGSPASISGSATLSTPAGFTSTVSGESTLASGFIFSTTASAITPAAVAPAGGVFNPNATLSNSAVIVVPTYSAAGGGTFVANSLSVGSAAAVTAPAASPSFSVAAAQVLNATTTAIGGSQILANTEFINAIIKSGAGVNGLD
jgi:hypothetical protein